MKKAAGSAGRLTRPAGATLDVPPQAGDRRAEVGMDGLGKSCVELETARVGVRAVGRIQR